MHSIYYILLNYTLLVFMFLQAFGTIKIGSFKMSKGWPIYFTFTITALACIDYILGFNYDFFRIAYVVIFTYLVVFNLAVIFDLYVRYPIINRLEHIVGGTVLAFVLNGIIKAFGDPIYTGFILQDALILFGVFNIVIVGHEIIELIIDKTLREKNIGPSLHDTNYDLAMGWIGFLIFILLTTI